MRLPVAFTLTFAPLALTACGEAPAPAPRAELPPAPPASAPAPAKPAPPSGRALFVATEFGLSPIACFIDQTRAFTTGEACLALTPTGAELAMMSGQLVKVTGRGTTSCPGAAPEATLQVELGRDLLRGDALWPSALKSALTYTSPTRPDEVDRDAPKELRERLARALATSFPQLGALKVRVEQRAELDLDGDGALEQLIALTVPAADDDAPLRLSALFLAAKDGALTLLRGLPDTREHYTVLGALDLDNDGRRELYLNTYDDEGFALSLEQESPEGLKTRGRWTCGA